MTATVTPTLRELFRVTGVITNGENDDWAIEPFEVTRDQALLAMFGGARITAGIYTKLRAKRGGLWMSDTPDEFRWNWPAMHYAHGRVLLNGLGLGCVLRAVVGNPEVEHVDVVEISQSLVDLMRECADWVNDPRVVIHVADAYEQMKAWPKGTRWNVAWHDIWQDITTENLPGMARLNRSYGRRADFQGCWSQDDHRMRR